MVSANIGCGETFYGDVRLDIIIPRNGDAPDIFASVEFLPFRSKVFSLIWFLEVLEHVDSPIKAIKELFRVCSGKLLIAYPNVFYYMRILRTIKRGAKIPVSLGTTHKQMFDLITIKQLFYLCEIKRYKFFWSIFDKYFKIVIDCT